MEARFLPDLHIAVKPAFLNADFSFLLIVDTKGIDTSFELSCFILPFGWWFLIISLNVFSLYPFSENIDTRSSSSSFKRTCEHVHV